MIKPGATLYDEFAHFQGAQRDPSVPEGNTQKKERNLSKVHIVTGIG